MARSSPSPLPGRGPQPDEVELGHVSGVFGVRGEVRLHLHNRDSILLEGPVDAVLVGPDGARTGVEIVARPGAGKRIIGRITGLDLGNPRHSLVALLHVQEWASSLRTPNPAVPKEPEAP